jgi:hypothetical protein
MELSPSWEAANCAATKNFPAFYGTWRFITMFTRALHWSLSWARSIQSIPSHPISLRSTFLLFRRGVVVPTPNPQAGGPPLVGCLRLLIQYICSYPPYLEVVSSIRNQRMYHAMVTGHPPNMFLCCNLIKICKSWIFTACCFIIYRTS